MEAIIGLTGTGREKADDSAEEQTALDTRVGENFRALLENASQQEGKLGRDAFSALEMVGSSHPEVGSSDHWRVVGADIRTGQGIAALIVRVYPEQIRTLMHQAGLQEDIEVTLHPNEITEHDDGLEP